MANILVRSPNWIGDQILAYPFFYALRQSHPDAFIASVCVEWVKDLQYKNLVDEVFVLPRAFQNTVLEKFKILEEGARKLRALKKWDLAISLPNSLSSQWLLYRSQARVKRVYGGEEKSLHRAQAYLNLVLSFQSETESLESILKNDFDPSKEWPEVEPLEPVGDPYWVLAPGSRAQSRTWPIDSFLELARKIYQETKWKGLVVGGLKEIPLAEYLVKNAPAFLSDWTSQGSAASLWKIFKNAKFTVSNDSGLAHLASLCGSFVQVVWGAGNPEHTRPLGPGRVQIFTQPVDCWPCEKNDCQKKGPLKLLCLKESKAQDVWEEISRGLSD